MTSLEFSPLRELHLYLCRATPLCGDSVRIFNPRRDVWAEHFGWRENATLIDGKTAVGRATVAALHLNRPSLVLARRIWVIADWHPPQE